MQSKSWTAPSRMTLPARLTRTLRDGDQRNGKLVTVTLDTKPHTVQKGRYTVSDFKRLVGVDRNYQLDEVVYGQFVELKDSEKVSIKGLFCGPVMEFPEGPCATAVWMTVVITNDL